MLQLFADAVKDFRFGARVLRRSPVFTVVAVASLALGIGGSAAVFSLINAIVLRALPVAEPHRLFLVERRQRDETVARFSWPTAQRLRDELAGRAEIAAATPIATLQFRLEGRGSSGVAERIGVQLVSGEYFDVLRQQPQRGRLLTPADNRQLDAQPVAVVSHGFWQRQLGGAADVVGRAMSLNGTTFTIVGVTEPRFFGNIVTVRGVDAWVPLVMQSAIRYGGNASSHYSGDMRKPWIPQEDIDWLNLLARVPRGSDPETIAAALTVRFQADASARRGADTDNVEPLRAERIALAPSGRGVSALRASTSPTLYVLLAMMAVLLLIACGNVAGLLTARAVAREREIAVRLSLGAGRPRLVRQLMAESLLLGAAGGVLGLGLAVWGRDLLLALLVGSQSAAAGLDTALDWPVLAFAAASALMTAVLCGTIPALRGTRVAIADSLKLQSRAVGSDTGRTLAVGRALVVAQIAFCLVLLVTAGLFVRSLRALQTSEIGFDRQNLLGARLDIRSMGLGAPERAVLYDRLLDRIHAIPGVVSASLSQNGPVVTSSQISGISIAGYTPREGERMSSHEEIVTERYFSTVGLRLLRGRTFGPDDRAGSKATLVNETMAKRYFPDAEALGKRWAYDQDTAITPEAFVIVGIVEDAKYRDLRGEVPSMTYHLSGPSEDALLSDLEIRTSGAPDTMIATVRKVLAEVEPRLPAYDIVPISARVARALAQESMVAELTTIFGAMALLLACLGLYGTIAYGVSRRVAELGLRLALGAERRQVLWLVMREALLLLALGAAIGLPLAYAAGRSLGTMLYGIGPIDPLAYTVGASLLVVVGLAAALVPALRASQIDPMTAMARS